MKDEAKVVAVMAANEALSSLLTAALAIDPSLRVRSFSSIAALHAYMRLAPVDVLVCDFDHPDAPAGQLVYGLRRDELIETPHFAAIALTRLVTGDMRHASVRSGIDEVIVKPMSPRHLVARVKARACTARLLVSGENGYRGPDRRNRFSFGAAPMQHQRRASDNVVALFPDRRAAPKHPGLGG